jgi:transposase
VEVFHNGARVASHRKDPAPGRHTTLSAHMPESHQAVSGWNAERFLSWAAKVGPATQQIIVRLLSSRRHPQQAFRSCLGLLSLAKRDSPDLLERACQKGLDLEVHSYREIRMLLESPGLRKPSHPDGTNPPPRTHGNLRGPEYYAQPQKGDPSC